MRRKVSGGRLSVRAGVAVNTTAATPASMPTTAAKTRDPWFDNAKMALVLLVVVGPLVDAAAAAPRSTTTSTTSSTPGTSRRSSSSPATCRAPSPTSRGRLWQLVRTVVVPYVVFECALALFRIYVGGEQLEDLFRDPHWPMWYLSALFFWRLLTPVFTPDAGRRRDAVAAAVSLVAGLYAGDTLDVARVLGLLPVLRAGPDRHPGAARAAPSQPSVRNAALLRLPRRSSW